MPERREVARVQAAFGSGVAEVAGEGAHEDEVVDTHAHVAAGVEAAAQGLDGAGVGLEQGGGLVPPGSPRSPPCRPRSASPPWPPCRSCPGPAAGRRWPPRRGRGRGACAFPRPRARGVVSWMAMTAAGRSRGRARSGALRGPAAGEIQGAHGPSTRTLAVRRRAGSAASRQASSRSFPVRSRRGKPLERAPAVGVGFDRRRPGRPSAPSEPQGAGGPRGGFVASSLFPAPVARLLQEAHHRPPRGAGWPRPPAPGAGPRARPWPPPRFALRPARARAARGDAAPG